MKIEARFIQAVENIYLDHNSYDDVIKSGVSLIPPIRSMVQTVFKTEDTMVLAYESTAYKTAEELFALGMNEPRSMLEYTKVHYVPQMKGASEEDIHEAREFFFVVFEQFLHGTPVREMIKVFLMEQMQPLIESMHADE